jgi:hypothetical protein
VPAHTSDTSSAPAASSASATAAAFTIAPSSSRSAPSAASTAKEPLVVHSTARSPGYRELARLERRVAAVEPRQRHALPLAEQQRRARRGLAAGGLRIGDDGEALETGVEQDRGRGRHAQHVEHHHAAAGRPGGTKARSVRIMG